MDSQSSSDNGAFADQLRQVSAFLEAIVADRALLAGLPAGDRKRFLDAVAAVYHPDVKARRQLVKAAKRQRKASKVRDEERALERTGIRSLRRQTVFTTPNYFPPPQFEQRDVSDAAEAPASDALQNCYVCKRDYSEIHHFYDQLCPPCAALNFAKRSELADLRGRVALLT